VLPSIYKPKFNQNYIDMEATLNYRFQRRSKNYFDWLLYTIKSEKYFEAQSQIVTSDSYGLKLSL